MELYRDSCFGLGNPHQLDKDLIYYRPVPR